MSSQSRRLPRKQEIVEREWLGANALFDLWWADPVTALFIAGVAVKEGRESWRGESCCTAPVVPGENCEDDCCR